MTKEDSQDEMKEKRREAVAAVQPTGNDKSRQSPAATAALIGPNRLVVELSMAKLDRAVYSQRQLEAVMEDFWFNHFNVFANKGVDRWLLTSYVRDTIRPHTMGKFSDLLVATAKSPGHAVLPRQLAERRSGSVRSNGASKWTRAAVSKACSAAALAPSRGDFPRVGSRISSPARPLALRQQQQERGLNENYGREVMELHTVGVDAGYTQQDVIEMAKASPAGPFASRAAIPEYMFRPEFHAQGKKVVMGHTFDYGGEKDGEEALKMLANDPHTARIHLHRTRAALRFRRSAASARRSHDARNTKPPAAIFAAFCAP